ncbi:unnamed protein product [Rhizophagus irregularis]|nr:unnamed protein product [Rhizophagus irregularis]
MSLSSLLSGISSSSLSKLSNSLSDSKFSSNPISVSFILKVSCSKTVLFVFISLIKSILNSFSIVSKVFMFNFTALLDVIMNDYNSNYYMETSKISSEFILLQYFFLFVSQIYKKGNIFVFFMVKFIVT